MHADTIEKSSSTTAISYPTPSASLLTSNNTSSTTRFSSNTSSVSAQTSVATSPTAMSASATSTGRSANTKSDAARSKEWADAAEKFAVIQGKGILCNPPCPKCNSGLGNSRINRGFDCRILLSVSSLCGCCMKERTSCSQQKWTPKQGEV